MSILTRFKLKTQSKLCNAADLLCKFIKSKKKQGQYKVNRHNLAEPQNPAHVNRVLHVDVLPDIFDVSQGKARKNVIPHNIVHYTHGGGA